MFNELKKLSMKNVMARFMICVVAIAIILAVFGTSFLKVATGPKDLSSLSVDELPNSYVEGDIYALIDVFAEYYIESDTGFEEVTESYYIIPVGEEEYIALEVDKDYFDLAEQIYDETYEYLIGDRLELSTTMTVTGTINEMESEVYDYYEDWFETSGFIENPTQEDIDNLALPYVLKIDHIGTYEDVTIYLVMGLCVLLLLYAVIVLIKGLMGSYLSPIKKYLKQNEASVSIERVESDYENAVSVENVRVGINWTYFMRGHKAYILSNSDIVWAYLEEVTHRVNGIKSGVTKSLLIYDKNKKNYSLSMKNSENVNSVLAVYSRNQPHIVLGFSEDLKKCFNKDFDTFLNLNYNKSYSDTNEGENKDDTTF